MQRRITSGTNSFQPEHLELGSGSPGDDIDDVGHLCIFVSRHVECAAEGAHATGEMATILFATMSTGGS